jgi:hypothetical protein
MQKAGMWKNPDWKLLSGLLVAGFCVKIAVSTLFLLPPGWLKWPGPQPSEAAVAPPAEATPLPPLPRLLALVDKERQALVARETAVKVQEEQLAVLKKELEERLKELQALQARVLEALEEEKRLQGEHNRHLVATLQAMPPDRAGKLLEKMEEPEAVWLLRRLPGKEAGAILSLLAPDRAARLSQRLMK